MTILDKLKAIIDKRNTWISKSDGIRVPVMLNEVCEAQLVIMEALIKLLEIQAPPGVPVYWGTPSKPSPDPPILHVPQTPLDSPTPKQ